MITLLLADDDQMITDMYKMKFTKLGFNVVIVSDPAEIMAKIEQSQPALVLLDRRMGEADGLDSLKALRQTEFGKSLPVIVLSNQDPTAEEFALVKGLG